MAAPSDRPLALLRGVTWILVFLMGGAGLLLLGVAGRLAFSGAGGLADFGLEEAPNMRLPVIAMIFLLIVIVGIAIRFFRELLAIIDTVGEGDPFAPVNADRLHAMGMLTLYGYGIALVIGAIGIYVKARAPGANITVDLDPGVLVLTLVLFVLARVFREGAEMRRDLEGTV